MIVSPEAAPAAFVLRVPSTDFGSRLMMRALLCLLVESSSPASSSCPASWRVLLALEHDICYNETNHWNALTDGQSKCAALATPRAELVDGRPTQRR